MYSINSAVKRVDFQLRKMSVEENLHTKYISFKNNNGNERVLGLKLKKMVNTMLK